MSNPEYLDHQATQGPQNRAQRTVAMEANNPKTGMTVGIVRFDVTIRGVDGTEIDAGMLTAPLRAGAKNGKLQVEPLDLQAAFAEALDTIGEER